MNLKADEIRQKMSSVRDDIEHGVDGIVEDAKSLVDWRDYIGAHPLVSLGAACAIGYALIPKRPQSVETDAKTVARLLHNEKLVVAPGAQVQQKKAFKGALLTTLAATVLRTAAVHVGQQFATSLSGKLRNDAAPGAKSSFGTTLENTEH